MGARGMDNDHDLAMSAGVMQGVESVSRLVANSFVSGIWEGIVLAAGGWDLSAAGAEDDGGGAVCDLDGGVWSAGGVAAGACVLFEL